MNTDAIRRQTGVVDACETAVAFTRDQINKVSARDCGQATASIAINGIPFVITALNRAWMPELVAGAEAIQRECLAMLQAELADRISRLEGAQWKLRQLIKD